MVYTSDIAYLKMNHDEKEWLTNFLHSFPHFSFSFKLTNSTFNPDDTKYVESIAFWALLPVAVCVLFILISCCCTCFQCKKERPQKRVKSCCPGGIIGVIIIIAMAAAAIGLYGNEKANDGVENFNSAVEDINATLSDALQTINRMHDIASNLAEKDIVDLQNALNQQILNVTVRTRIGDYTKEMLDQSKKAKADIKQLISVTPNENLDFISDNTKKGEFIRWTSTIIVLSVALFILVVSLCGCCKKSRCLLAMCISVGFFTLFLTWLLNGVYLGGSVANADLCVDPENFIEDVVSKQIEKDIIKTYIECKDGDAAGKYSQDISDALNAITLANNTLDKIWNISISLSILRKVGKPIAAVRTQLNYGHGNLTALSSVFQCQRTHDNYMKIKDSVCNTILFNMCILLAAFMILSLMLSWLQCILPKMWHISGKRRGSGYRPVDDTDPFVPRPPPYQDYGSLYGIGSTSGPSRPQPLLYMSEFTLSSGGAINMMGGPPLDSPPPAYSVRGFGQHYRTSSDSESEH